jgi:hypothetical protein
MYFRTYWEQGIGGALLMAALEQARVRRFTGITLWVIEPTNVRVVFMNHLGLFQIMLKKMRCVVASLSEKSAMN